MCARKGIYYIDIYIKSITVYNKHKFIEDEIYKKEYKYN